MTERAAVWRPLITALLVLCALAASAQNPPSRAEAAAAAPPTPTVAYSGRLGNRALLVIDGQPRTLGVGESAGGVRLLALRDDGQAEVTVAGRRTALRLGAAPVVLAAGGQSPSVTPLAGRRVVMEADAGGHFASDGTINGRSTRFLVDTGATFVSISQAEADRLGIAFRDAPRGTATTANGEVPVHRVRLDSVRVGALEVPMVDAVVLPAALPHVLLGNSFLGRVQMNRDGPRMTLERRP